MGLIFDDNPESVVNKKFHELELLCCPPDSRFGDVTKENVLKICRDLFEAGFEEGQSYVYRSRRENS